MFGLSVKLPGKLPDTLPVLCSYPARLNMTEHTTHFVLQINITTIKLKNLASSLDVPPALGIRF